ncbi:hypothetical protein C8R41DRAFT_812338 [Lentinula lateritia]|uniref:Uncharacterized protein n=1 Tax=Lentinula lateritia TaxID=40482 RepID=A0ABQ8VTZ1_9AGAR|nr:hypothetical protein C8R41DRAFT_812338 [Lentinula lateritia]
MLFITFIVHNSVRRVCPLSSYCEPKIVTYPFHVYLLRYTFRCPVTLILFWTFLPFCDTFI